MAAIRPVPASTTQRVPSPEIAAPYGLKLRPVSEISRIRRPSLGSIFKIRWAPCRPTQTKPSASIATARGIPPRPPTSTVHKMHSSRWPKNSEGRSITPSPSSSREVSIRPLPFRSMQSSSRLAILVTVPWFPNVRLATYTLPRKSTAVRLGQFPRLRASSQSWPGGCAPLRGPIKTESYSPVWAPVAMSNLVRVAVAVLAIHAKRLSIREVPKVRDPDSSWTPDDSVGASLQEPPTSRGMLTTEQGRQSPHSLRTPSSVRPSQSSSRSLHSSVSEGQKPASASGRDPSGNEPSGRDPSGLEASERRAGGSSSAVRAPQPMEGRSRTRSGASERGTRKLWHEHPMWVDTGVTMRSGCRLRYCALVPRRRRIWRRGAGDRRVLIHER